MNQSLFRSRYAIVAILALAALIAVLAFSKADFGVVGARSHGLRLWTGSIALACMLLALGYVLRKYMHKYGYSPEFRLKVPIIKLEQAETRISEIRRQILKGQLSTRKEVESLVSRALREVGVQRIVRVEVAEGASGGPKFTLKVGKAFPFGKAAKWLHLHLYISVAFAFAVWVHGGTGWDSPLGAVLLGFSTIVLVTGVIGIFLWAFGPAWLTNRERDLSIEEAFVLREGFSRKLAELREKMEPDLRAVLDDVSAKGADRDQRARVLLAAMPAADTARRIQLQDALVLGGQLQRVESEFKLLWRTRLGFMAWRAVHLPAALFLSIAVVVHMISIAVY
ncbi:MAG TPA: hypothetical protein VK843_17905 [Planctomycetota bacterium]|nr:hypothetical protein [Planctomycetota bacterium]